MKVQNITSYSNYNKNFNIITIGKNSDNPTDMQSESYSEDSAKAITNAALAGIAFSGNVEHMMLRKIKNYNADSAPSYEARLSESRSTCTSGSIKKSAVTAICNSKYYIPNSKIVGNTEKSELDYNPVLDKTVYFADNGEKVYSGIKSSYDYVVYPPEARDFSSDSEFDGEYDVLSDWESYGWVEDAVPSWI